MPRLLAPRQLASPRPAPTDKHPVVRQQLMELAMEAAIKRRHLETLKRSKESVREKESFLRSHTVRRRPLRPSWRPFCRLRFT
eukprot:COSAG01_NODE_12540_length_1722_cov_66.949476_2_plen_83_part_00